MPTSTSATVLLPQRTSGAVADHQPGAHEWGYCDRTIQQFLDFAMEA